MSSRRFAVAAGAVALLAVATPALARGGVAEEWRWLAFLVFGVIIAPTMRVALLSLRCARMPASVCLPMLRQGSAITGGTVMYARSQPTECMKPS